MTFFELAENQRTATAAEIETIARNADPRQNPPKMTVKNCRTCKYYRVENGEECCLLCSVYLDEDFAPEKCYELVIMYEIRQEVMEKNPFVYGEELEEKIADEMFRRRHRLI